MNTTTAAIAETQTPSEFVRFWNGTLADKFERYRDILMNGLSYHGRVALADLAVPPGSQIADVGCGWGDTAIELAEKTGKDGHVLGLDCVDRFLEKGRRDAAARGVRNVSFVAADVQSYPFTAQFDLCFSRFGMMFFENPVWAMRNIRRGLKPGGRIVFVTWRTIEDNPWFGLPKKVVLEHLPPPGEDAQSCGPGPFSMSNANVVTAQLEAAGFTDARFRRFDGPVTVGRNIDEAIDFQLALGPAGEIFREAGDEAKKKSATIRRALGDTLSPYLGRDGVVMQSSSWSISAINPA